MIVSKVLETCDQQDIYLSTDQIIKGHICDKFEVGIKEIYASSERDFWKICEIYRKILDGDETKCMT